MALTINPAVSGGRMKFVAHSAVFLVGVFVGALVTLTVVLAAAMAARVLISDRLLALALISLVSLAICHDVGLPVPLPYRRQQVPEWLRQILPTSAIAAVYGFMLGVGFLTLFTYSTQVAVLLALPFLPSLWEMLLVLLLFAAGKTIVVVSTAGTSSLGEVSSTFVWNRRRAMILRVGTATASAAVAVVLIASSRI